MTIVDYQSSESPTEPFGSIFVALDPELDYVKKK
jgi:hypothetical protein